MNRHRQHFNRHGVPKPALEREEAIVLALEYTFARGLQPDRRHLGAVDAYECRRCGAWHVGTSSQPMLQVELGHRVFWNLEVENQGDPVLRCLQLTMRARRRGREAIPSRAA